MKNIFASALFALLLAMCSSAPIASSCERAEFIDHVLVDVPVEEGTALMPGTHFTKTWQVLNAGTCAWGEGYALVHTGGHALSGAPEIALPAVAAGETVDLSLRLTAPSLLGTYTSEWMLRNAAGALFGVGPQGDRPLTAALVVPELPAGVVYDFAQVMCLARWDSDRASFLPCEGLNDEQGMLDGYVSLAPNGTIEVKPNNQPNGLIAGYFPPVTVQAGDHFRATVGCVDENPNCEIVFMLKYRVDEGGQTSADEIIFTNPFPLSGEQITDIDMDLSALQGNVVTFILFMQENGGRSLDAIGYWLNPRIENTAP